MPEKKFKPIFERTLSEQSALINPQIEKVQMENINRGLYNIFRDNNYQSKKILVRQYKDRKEVIKVDALTGHTQIIKTIR